MSVSSAGPACRSLSFLHSDEPWVVARRWHEGGPWPDGITGSVRVGPWSRGLPVQYRDGPRGWCDTDASVSLSLVRDDGSPVGVALSRVVLEAPRALRKGAGALGHAQFAMLALGARCAAALELSVANPVLLALVADAAVRTQRPLRDWCRALDWKQDHLLAEVLEAPPQFKAAWLRRVPVPGSESELQLLRGVLTQPRLARRLRHWTSLSPDVLRIVTELPDLLDWRSVHGLGVRGDAAALLRLLLALAELPRARRDELWRSHRGNREAVRVRVAIRRLDSEIDGVSALIDCFRGRSFRPLLPGGAHVRPLVRLEDIECEGESMAHCVRSYISAVVAGEQSIYHVDADVPATLAITPGVIPRTELRGPANARPSAQAVGRVAAWLREQLEGDELDDYLEALDMN